MGLLQHDWSGHNVPQQHGVAHRTPNHLWISRFERHRLGFREPTHSPRGALMRMRRMAVPLVISIVAAMAVILILNDPWATSTLLESGVPPDPAGVASGSPTVAGAETETAATVASPSATPQPSPPSEQPPVAPTNCVATIQLEPGGPASPTPQAALQRFVASALQEAARVRDDATYTDIERGRARALHAGGGRLRLVENDDTFATFQYVRDGAVLAVGRATRGPDGWRMTEVSASAPQEVCSPTGG